MTPGDGGIEAGRAAAPRDDAAEHTRGTLLVLAAAALFSTGGALLKSPTVSHWQVAGTRAAIAAVAMLAFVPAARRRWTGATFLVGLAYAATLTAFALATRLTTAANAIFLQSTASLWMLLLSPWLLHERIRRGDVVFMAVLAAGLSLFFVGREESAATAPNPFLGNMLGVASGLTWAFAVSGLRRLAREDAEGSGGGGAAAASTVAGNVICAAVCLPLAYPFQQGTATDWAALAFLGVVQVALAYVCLTRGVRRVPAFEASLLLLLEPVLNPVWTWIVHDERPSAWALTGGAVILVATAAHTLASRARS